MRVAVVTPYHGEAPEVLWRCHASVMAQTHRATHIMVADGQPSAAVASWDVQHLVLPSRHGDGGDTPRGLGALTALNQGFDAVAYLDADNWFADDHVATCLETCRQTGAHISFASRQIVLASGQLCAFEDRDAIEHRHVDTSCFFVLRDAAAMFALWAMIDPGVWQACDRIMLSAVRARGVPHAWTHRKSVYYTSKWGLHYRAMGLEPPLDEHQIDWEAVAARYDPTSMAARFGFDPDLDLTQNDHVRPDRTNPMDYLNRVVVSGRDEAADIKPAHGAQAASGA